MASVMDDIAWLNYSEEDSTGIGIKTAAKTRSDVDGLKKAEGKVDITTLDKTNKIPKLISY